MPGRPIRRLRCLMARASRRLLSGQMTGRALQKAAVKLQFPRGSTFMKLPQNPMLCAAVLLVAGGIAPGQIPARSPASSMYSYISAAKAAAGTDWAGTFVRLCIAPPPARAGRGGAAPAAGDRVIPSRETWYAEPRKVADNLYFLGTKIHSSWAIVGSEGIIIIEALYDYAASDEILEGMKKLGLDQSR